MANVQQQAAAQAAVRVPPAAPVVIDFDDLATSGPGTGGQVLVLRQYADLGITFNGAFAIDYSKGQAIPGFAHSGNVAIEQCYGKEFCTTPIEMMFTSTQDRVKVWVGYSSRLLERRTIILTAFDAQGLVVAQAITGLGPSPNGPIPIQASLEATSGAANIERAQVAFLPSALMNGLAVDDVEFDTVGPRPPCQSTQNPSVVLTEPLSGALFGPTNEFEVAGTIITGSPLDAATISVSTAAGTKTLDLLSSGNISTQSGILTLGRLRINEMLSAGQNTIVFEARDCRGSGRDSVMVTYRPPEWFPFPIQRIRSG